ncbi:hypothetical protein [Oceanisphaera sp. IT1-181]|uniref:hypothetical protein n=1 Tax=Oceanisphaera sp. IT1-181 TaxID=3081199 RepID=UPI0029CA0C96|nr:hypothetical protein [Oceanisphaera sp. IT1-181]
MKKTRTTAIPDEFDRLKQQLFEMQTLLQKTQQESLHHQQEAKRFQLLYHQSIEQWQLALKNALRRAVKVTPAKASCLTRLKTA